MHSLTSNKNNSNQSYLQLANTKGSSLLRHWMARAVRNWHRRKMIAALDALDTRILNDIGIERSDIERVVDGFDAHELQMVPLAKP